MNPIQKYQEFINYFENANKKYIKEIDNINNDPRVPKDTKDFMISNRMEYIEKNNEIIDELKKMIEKAANTTLEGAEDREGR